MDVLREYKVFIDLGEYDPENIPPGFKQIRCHMIFDIKYDGRHKARMVAGGHQADIPIDSVYSGVVSLRGFRMCVFLAELNGMQTYTTDITSACLELYTNKKIVVKAGAKFGEWSRHLLLVSKSLWIV